jgi:hypothetical protein
VSANAKLSGPSAHSFFLEGVIFATSRMNRSESFSFPDCLASSLFAGSDSLNLPLENGVISVGGWLGSRS